MRESDIFTYLSIFIKWPCLCFFLLLSCSSEDDIQLRTVKKTHEKGEFILRKHDDYFYRLPIITSQVMNRYPWEGRFAGKFPSITKQHFACKGKLTHPVRVIKKEGKDPVILIDCRGFESHTLPIKDGHEFVYPILLEILNYLQDHFEKQVIVTCGHRCPEHNVYADERPYNYGSKHQIGAEVDFYITDMEQQPEVVIKQIQQFYRENSKYEEKKDFQNFKRYEKSDLDVSTAPWYNQEIFIKLYKKNEGRDLDNQHPYPYISLQVRYDTQAAKRVIFSWEEAKNGFRKK